MQMETLRDMDVIQIVKGDKGLAKASFFFMKVCLV